MTDTLRLPDRALAMANMHMRRSMRYREPDSTVSGEPQLGEQLIVNEFIEPDQNEKAYAKPLVNTSAFARLLFSALLYYFDVISDFLLVISLFQSHDLRIAGLVCFLLAGRVFFVCVLDMCLAGGMGWKGVLLNLFEVRMLYYLVSSCTKDRNPVMTKRAAGDLGLFEALLEALPQSLLQAYLMLALAKDHQNYGTRVIVSSLCISCFRLTITVSGKLLTTFQRDSNLTFLQGAAVHLYFLCDILSRSFSLGVFFLYASPSLVALGLVTYILVELFLLLLPERHSFRNMVAMPWFELLARLGVGLMVSMPLNQHKPERWRVFAFSTIASVVFGVGTLLGYDVQAQTFVLSVVLVSSIIKVATFLAVLIRFPDGDVTISLSNLVLTPVDANSWTSDYWRSFISNKSVVNLSRRRLTVDGAETMVEALRGNVTARTLDLTNNLLETPGCEQAMKALTQANSITSLVLKTNMIEFDACESIAVALQAPLCHLQHLDLYNNYIGDQGCAALANGLRDCSLIRLNLGANGIGNIGAATLGNVLGSATCRLVELSLWSNNVETEGAQCLFDALARNSSLLLLNLYNNNVGDDCEEPLQSMLRSNTTLSELNLGRNPISAGVLQRVNQVGSTCYINHSPWF